MFDIGRRRQFASARRVPTRITLGALHERLRGFIRNRVRRAGIGAAAFGIRAKMLAFTCALVALFVAGDLILDVVLESTRTRRSAAPILTELAEGLATTVTDKISAGNSGDLVAIARTIALSSEVDDVYLFDREGKIIAQDVSGDHPAPTAGEPTLLHAMVDRKAFAIVEGTTITAAAPITSANGVSGYVLLRGSSGNTNASGFGVMALAAAVLLLGGLAATVFSGWLVRPLESLTAATGRIAAGDLAKPAMVDSGDEFEMLAAGLNRVMTSATAAISAHEDLQRELTARHERAEAASRAKSEFLAKVGYELRASLNAIVGFSDLLAGPRSRVMGDKTFTTYARDINRSGRHLLTLVTNVLDYVQIDVAPSALNEELCDIAQLVRGVAAPFDGLAEDGGVTLTVDSTSALPAVSCDRERLGKALASLLSMAIRATRAGGYVAVTVAGDGFDSVIIRIADNGPGQPIEDVETVQSSLTQAPIRGYAGAGLVLAVARKIVEQHLGDLRVESYPNIGTVVTVRLPAVPADQSPAERTPIRVS